MLGITVAISAQSGLVVNHIDSVDTIPKTQR